MSNQEDTKAAHPIAALVAKALPGSAGPVLVGIFIAATPWFDSMFKTATQGRDALVSVSTNLPVIMQEFRKTTDQIQKIGERLDRHIEQTDRFHREVDGRIRKIEDKVGDLFTPQYRDTAKPSR